MVDNLKQQAAAELSIGLGHLQAALHLWSPISGRGLTPAQEREDSEVAAWNKLKGLVEELDWFHHQEGPGA